MRIVVTGADGRMGSVLTSHWKAQHEVIAIGDATDLRRRGDWEARLADADAVVHLAAVMIRTEDVSVMQDNIDMLINVVRAGEAAKRFVYASSMWAAHEQTGLGARSNYYAAVKQAGEAIVRGWADVQQRPAVSLRLGHFGSEIGSVPIEHEMLRLDDTTLRWWFDRALTHDAPGCAVWQATGLSAHL